MEYLGQNGWPAPRLKDAKLTNLCWQELYYRILKYLRVLFWKAKLVHADLSEYNLLYSKNKLYFIDVSQSVEHEHPQALKFLEMDCKNINTFFRKQGLLTCTDRELFQYILTENLSNEQTEKKIEQMQRIVEQRHRNNLCVSIKNQKNTTFNSWIPTELKEIKHVMKLNLRKNPILKMTLKQRKNEILQNNLKNNIKENKRKLSDKKIRRKMNKYDKRKIRKVHKQVVKAFYRSKRKKKIPKYIKKRAKQSHKKK